MRTVKRTVAVSGLAIALITAATALAATPQPGSSFSGPTSQEHGSVSFGVSADGRLVTNFQAIMTALCKKEGQPNATIEVGLAPAPKIPIHDDRFRYTGGIELYEGSELIGSGDGQIRGGFTSPTIASGTLSFRWRYNSNAGKDAKGYLCETADAVTFAASPPGSSPPSSPPPPSGGSGSGSGSSSSSCVVPKLQGKKLRTAKRTVRRANCLPGRIVRRSSNVKRGRVIAQKPSPGTRLGAGAKVRLVVSRGPAG